MELQSRGVGVVSSASAPSAGANEWWKGTMVAKKASLGADSSGKEIPPGDWQCQSYNCSAVNFRRNDKCFKCGAAKRTGPDWGRSEMG